MKNLTKLWTQALLIFLSLIAKGLFAFTKITRTGSGTSLPGLLVENFCPFILTSLTVDMDKIILITGTNGKTTTRALLVHLYENNGYQVCTNRGGANIMRGIASSLLLNRDWTGKPKSKIAILEVEEATLPNLTKFVLPNTLILTNIFRDQLDVYGEIDQTLRYFSTSISQITKNSQKRQSFRTNFEGENLEDNLKDVDELARNERIGNNTENNFDNDFDEVLDSKKDKAKLSGLAKTAKSFEFWKLKISKVFGTGLKKTGNGTKSKLEGLFGRQFPKKNIYESGFDNSANLENESAFDNEKKPEKDLQVSKERTQKQQNQIYLTTKSPTQLISKLGDNLELKQELANEGEIQHNSESNSFQKNSHQNANAIRSSKLSNPEDLVKIDKITQISLKNQPKSVKNSDPVSFSQLPQIIVNTDDSKLLTCLESCTLPIIGFGLQTDNVNKPKFEENNQTFEPNFSQTYLAKNLVVRDNFSRFTIKINNEELALQTQLPGFFNLYNVMAVLASLNGGRDNEFSNSMIKVIEDFAPVFGRGEKIQLKNNKVKLFLVKNPVGFEQVLDLVHTKTLDSKTELLEKLPANKSNRLNLAFLINDKIADGRDLSWLWDVDFENFLLNTHVDRIITGGLRGPDILLRLEMADWKADINDNKNMNEIVEEIIDSPDDWVVCATYTAMLDFRAKIGKYTKLKTIDSMGY